MKTLEEDAMVLINVNTAAWTGSPIRTTDLVSYTESLDIQSQIPFNECNFFLTIAYRNYEETNA